MSGTTVLHYPTRIHSRCLAMSDAGQHAASLSHRRQRRASARGSTSGGVMPRRRPGRCRSGWCCTRRVTRTSGA